MFYTLCNNAVLHLASLKKKKIPCGLMNSPPPHPPPILLKTSVESMFYTVCINECNAILHMAVLVVSCEPDGVLPLPLFF